MKQQKPQQHKDIMSKELKEQKMRRENILKAAVLLTTSCIFLIVCCITLGSMGFFHMIKGWTVPRGSVEQGVISKDGQISSIPEGEIRFRLNSDVVFENSYSRGSIMLENPKASEYILQFSFYTLRDSKKAIYVSPKLSPGECLLTDKLTEHVQKGYYSCTCVVSAYDSDGKYCGKNTAAVSLNIIDN